MSTSLRWPTSSRPRPEDPAISTPRSSRGGQGAPRNVVVLCANCHTKVDKAPDTYPAELLRDWKRRHEETLQRVFGTPQFSTRQAARASIAPLLEGNRAIFDQYGPVSGQFSEARAAQWRRHVIATIVPNNAVVRRVLKRNRALLGPQECPAWPTSLTCMLKSSLHDTCWVTGTAGSTRFPEDMSTIFEGEAT